MTKAKFFLYLLRHEKGKNLLSALSCGKDSSKNRSIYLELLPLYMLSATIWSAFQKTLNKSHKDYGKKFITAVKF